jgi:site-specific DNA recombinase
MSFVFYPPLAPPKNGHTYAILAVCRVSDPGPGKQDPRSLTDQEHSYRELLDAALKVPYVLTVIAGSGSGELLTRDALYELDDKVATRNYDLVLTEDLGRIARRIQAYVVCEHCEDHDTRLYSMNDHVDTVQPNWREAAIFAAFHHERSNRDTSDRIKRSHRSRFVSGGCLRQAVYGWIKPLGAKNDSEMSKDPAAEPIYREWFRMLDEDDDATFADVARFLKSHGIRFFPRGGGETVEPDGKSVARHTFNVLLKGVRERNRRKSKRMNKEGEYISVKAPLEDLLIRHVPHLAFFDASYYDRVVAKIKTRHSCYRRSSDPAADPCLRRSRKHSRAPGKITSCLICRRPYIWGGHGQKDRMECRGSREHRCWNGITFDGPSAARQLLAAVLRATEELPDFDTGFMQILQEEHLRLDHERQRNRDQLEHELAKIKTEIANVIAFIKSGTAMASLAEELAQLEHRRSVLVGKVDQISRRPRTSFELPSINRIRGLVRDAVAELPLDGYEFATILRKLVPRMVVYPVRLCDGGKVVLRARVRVQLSNLLPDREVAEALRRPLERLLVIDLFEPPQRMKFSEAVVAARAAGQTESEAARACGITITAAQKAMVLRRKMDELGLQDPYVPVHQPPSDSCKLRGHLHPDYRFEPLDGVEEL